ncbi:MAG: two-component regulator propeller domain-containing protein [Bacteroidota bacterium]
MIGVIFAHLFLLPPKANSQDLLITINDWKAFPAVKNFGLLEISSNTTWARADHGLLRIDSSGEVIDRYSIANGMYPELPTSSVLTDDGSLYTGYMDGTIQILDDHNFVNIDAIRRSDRFTQKRVNDLKNHHQTIWVATQFGIVTIDKSSHRILDSYTQLGDLDQGMAINSLSFGIDSVYVAAEGGMAVANIDDNLKDKTNWRIYRDFGRESGIAIAQVLYLNEIVYIVSAEGTVYYRRIGEGWNQDVQWGEFSIDRLFTGDSDDIYGMTDRNILRGKELNSGPVGQAVDIYRSQYPITSAEYNEGEVFVSYYFNGIEIVNKAGELLNHWEYESPYTDLVSEITVTDSLVIYGTSQNFIQDDFRNAAKGIEILNQESGDWSNLNYYSNEAFREVDFYYTDQVQLKYPYIWANAYGKGIGRYNLKTKELDHWYADNSTLEGVNYDPAFIATTDVQINDDKVSVISFLADNPIYQFENDNWQRIERDPLVSSQLSYYEVNKHSEGNYWISLRSDLDTGDGMLIADLETGNSIRITDEQGRGNLPDNTVTRIVEDKNGEIWIGTQRGIARFRFPDFVLSGNAADREAEWLRNRDTTAASPYLLRDIHVTDIGINAANQKWITTQNSGLWLLNEDGDEILKHLTADNSLLPSNSIPNIGIDKANGYVYLGTGSGLMRFKETARSVASTKETIYIYPNPFRYDKHEQITLDKINAPADVHILSSGGVKVAEMNAQSSRIEWSGHSALGNKLQSGVYIVVALGNNGSKQTGKIVVIN